MQLTEAQILQTLMQARTRISAAAWLVVRDAHAAEDIFQNVALKALTRQVSFPSAAAVLSWASVTARREGIDWLRRTRRESPALDDTLLDLLDRDWAPSSESDPGPRSDALRECLEDLPQDAQRLLGLRYADGRSGEEIATALRLELNAVYKRLSRLHLALRHCVEGKLASPRTP